MKNLSLFGIILALCAALLWGTAGTAQSFAQEMASSYWIGAFRLVCACLLFCVLSLVMKGKSGKAPLASFMAGEKGYRLCVLAAGTCIALFNLLFFTGMKTAGVAVGSATVLGSAPMWAGLIQAVVSRKSPAPVWWIGTACAIAGGFAMTVSKGTALDFSFVGLAVCLGAGACYALYTVLSKQLVRMASPLTITTHIFTIAALIAVPAALIIAGRPIITGTDALIIFYLGMVTTVLAYLLYTKALNYISAPTGVALGLFEPITAFVLAATVVGEQITLLSALGLFMILCGLWIVLRAELRLHTHSVALSGKG